jgi:protein TonB
MTTLAIRYVPGATLSLPRIGAWSASISIHVVALALLLSAPVAYKIVSEAPKDETIITRFIEEKPIPQVKDLEPPKPIEHHEKKALPRPPTVTPPTDFKETTSVSIPTDTHVSPPVADAGPVALPEPDTQPSAIGYGSKTAVAYPYPSLKAREQGTVMLLVLVGVDGHVEDIRVEKSSGYVRLDRAALNTVKLWNFNPARHGGVAERAWAKVPISFTLATL